MSVKDPWSVKQLVAAAQQLHAARLHERFSDHDCFLLRTPKLDEPAVAVLMGHGGMTYGLNVFLGAGAMAAYQALFTARGEAQAHRVAMQSHLVGYQMSDAAELTHDARRWLKQANVRPAGEAMYPDPMCIEPGKVPVTLLKDRDTRLLLHLVRGILAAAQDPAFKPAGVDRRGCILAVQLTADAEHPAATIAWEPSSPTRDADRPADAPTVQPITARFDLTGLASSGDRWLVSLLPVPCSIRGDDRQPHMLAVCSQKTDRIFPSLLMQTQPADLADALARLMRGEVESPAHLAGKLSPPPVGLPAQLICDSEALRQAVRGAFEPLGVQCLDGSNDPASRRLFDILNDSFQTDLAAADDDDDDDALDDDAIPQADDLDGWKQVDGWLKDLIHDGFDEDRRYRGTRAMKQYFGPGADATKLFKQYQRLMIVDSYAHWFATGYRSARSRPTLAEQWLDDPDFPAAVKVLLRAILACAPSLYRVEEADDETGKITFTDLFTGQITIATDFALSTCLEPDWLVPARLVPVGAFHFYFPAGPVFNSFDLSEVMDFFNHQQITDPSQALGDQPHLLGRLWEVLDDHRKRGVELRNSDGHALLLHTAVFACPDRAAIEQFLASQPDHMPDGDDPDAWVWFRPGTDMLSGDDKKACRVETHMDADTGPVTLLGQLERKKKDRLTLTVNSRQRFDAARARLEQVQGVKLLSCRTQAMPRLADAAASHDDAEPDHEEPTGQVDPHVLDAARARLADHYRGWLDQPIPALRGKTPRQAAQDPTLRLQLAAMVRAMPDPIAQGDHSIQIRAPRQMLLAELGLE